MDTFLLGFYDELEKLAKVDPELTRNLYSTRMPRAAAHMDKYGPKYSYSQMKNFEEYANRVMGKNVARSGRMGMLKGVGGTLGAGLVGIGGYKLYKHFKDKKKKKQEA